MSSTTKQRGVLGLDLVRFAAALGVAIYHLAWWWWLPDIAGEQGRQFHEGLAPLREPFRWGWVGVEIFFTLSGFVIAFSAHGRSAGAFLKGRAQRLYPAAWICGTCTLLGAKWGAPGVTGEYIGSMTLWIFGPWISGVYWTLSVEIIFYALVAGVLRVGGRLSTLGTALGMISAIYWAIRVLDFVTGGHGKEFLAMAEGIQIGRLTLLATGSYFATGIMLWSLTYEKNTGSRKCLLLVFVAASMIGVMGEGHYQITSEGGRWWQVIEPALLWLAGLGLMGLSIRWNDKLWHRFGRFSAQFRLAGLVTYPLYLVHSEIGRRLMWAVRGLGPYPALAVALVAVLMLAMAVVGLERFPRQLLRWLLNLRFEPRPLASPDLP